MWVGNQNIIINWQQVIFEQYITNIKVKSRGNEWIIVNKQIKFSNKNISNARDKIICRNIRLRDSILDGSRFSPSIDSAMSERVEVGNHRMRLTA